MRREYRERFPRRPLQRKPLVSDPGMYHGTWVTYVPWCMLGSLICGGGENVPVMPGACATRNFTYLIRGPCLCSHWLVEIVCDCILFTLVIIRLVIIYKSVVLHFFPVFSKAIYLEIDILCIIHYYCSPKCCNRKVVKTTALSRPKAFKRSRRFSLASFDASNHAKAVTMATSPFHSSTQR